MKRILIVVALLLAVLMLFAACGGAVQFKLNFIVDGEIYATIDTSGNESVKLPENPTKEGDTFDGWYWDKDTWQKPFTANSLLDAPLSSDMNVYAKWASDGAETAEPTENPSDPTPVEPDLTKAEIVSAPLFAINGQNLSLTLPNATESFSFIGQITVSEKATWQISTDMYGLNSIPTKTVPLNIEDNTFYLLVTSGDANNINLYTVKIRRRPIDTVTFDSNGGSEVASQQVEEDSLATKPSDPERTGYTFAGWDYDFAMPITEDTKITAVWKTITYTISYELNGGTNAASNPQTYTIESETITFAEPEPTRTDYDFAGWDISEIPNGSYGNKTITASWKPTVYTITYIMNGGTNAASNPATYTIEDKTIVFAEPTRAGYHFAGWNISEIPNGSTENKIIIANWDAIFTLSDNSITGLTTIGKTLTTIEIPSEIDGVAITSIGSSAFYGCRGLKTLVIGNGVTSLPSGLLSGCSSLESLTIPFVGAKAGVTSSDTYQYPFGYIFGTSDYTGGTKTTQSYYGSSTSSTTNTTYYIPTSLKSVTVTGGNILYGAFYGCRNLTSITIPNSVTNIGAYAFYNCSGLTSITIPNSVKSIGNWAFYSCYKLIEVHNLSSLTITAGSYFNNGNVGCNAKHIYRDGESYLHTTDDGYVFYENGDEVYLVAYNGNLTELTLPENYNGKNYAINQYAFYNCSGLTSITIPNSVTSIGRYAFSESALASVAIPNSVTNIGAYAFAYCSGLTSITIPNSVTNIGAYAFAYCSGLTSIEIPNNVTSIESGAFNDCSGLTSVTFANTSGWYTTRMQGAISGTNMTVTDASTNASNLRTNYYDHYWYRK